MVFTPAPDRFEVGDRVSLREAVRTAEGTFSKGHQFVVLGFHSDRGETVMELKDDAARRIYLNYEGIRHKIHHLRSNEQSDYDEDDHHTPNR